LSNSLQIIIKKGATKAAEEMDPFSAIVRTRNPAVDKGISAERRQFESRSGESPNKQPIYLGENIELYKTLTIVR